MTQGQLEEIPLRVSKAFSDLEIRIMSDIVRRIKINGFSTASADWQMTRLQQLGKSEEEIKKWIRMALETTEEEMERIFSDEVYAQYMGHERAYKVNGMEQIPFEKNEELQSLIESVRQQTGDSFKNITGSMGFVKQDATGKLKAVELSEYYKTTLDNAMWDIHSGAFDYQTVLTRTINDMTKSGVRWIDYGSGRHDRIDVAARRAIMTGFRQVQGKINEQVADQLGTDTYEVTYHVGARPDHQPWQGKVWTMKQLRDVCGLGTVTGLHGANCYHDYNAFIPGVSVRTYTDEQLDQMISEENAPKIYNGKKYTTYEALQQQRRMERNMRKTRQDIKLLEEGEADSQSIMLKKGRYYGQMQAYVDFSEKMKLPQQKDRIYQDGLKGSFSSKAAYEELQKQIEEKRKNVTIKVPDTSKCVYITEKDYSEMVKKHAKNTDKADIKQIAKHTKSDGSPGGYVATHNYSNINSNMRKDGFSTRSLDEDDRNTIEAMRRAIAQNALEKDCILTRYVNADYISFVFGIKTESGEILSNYNLTDGYRRGKLVEQVVEKIKGGKGKTITEEAFISTSLLNHKNIMQDKAVRITIRAPKGTRCYIPKNKKESECILADNTKLYITDAQRSLDGKVEIFAVLL